MAEGPVFARFVSAVRGQVVPRYGTSEFIGARRVTLTREQIANGELPFEWDEETIVPLTDCYCREYVRELNEHVATNALRVCTREQWEAQQKQRAERARKEEQTRKAQSKKPPEGKEQTT